MDYREYAPHPSLQRIVRCYWTLSVPQNAPDPPAPALPDGCPELILNFASPICAATPTGTVETQPAIMLVGQITRPFVVAPTGRIEIVAVRFSPFGASILYPGLSRLTNHWTNAAELHPSLRATLPTLARIGAAERMAQLDEQMREIIGGCPSPNPLVVSAVERITAYDGALEIAHEPSRPWRLKGQPPEGSDPPFSMAFANAVPHVERLRGGPPLLSSISMGLARHKTLA